MRQLLVFVCVRDFIYVSDSREAVTVSRNKDFFICSFDPNPSPFFGQIVRFLKMQKIFSLRLVKSPKFVSTADFLEIFSDKLLILGSVRRTL